MSLGLQKTHEIQLWCHAPVSSALERFCLTDTFIDKPQVQGDPKKMAKTDRGRHLMYIFSLNTHVHMFHTKHTHTHQMHTQRCMTGLESSAKMLLEVSPSPDVLAVRRHPDR